MRIRSVKPEFFKDEQLADLDPAARLLFTGLWCMADREGRLEDRPRRIKAEILPYDDVDIEELLEELADAHFIIRYSIGNLRCIEIRSFLRHQIPGRDEPQSELPSPEGKVERYVRPPNETIRFRLYQRDNFTCVYCGLDMRDKARARTLDHVIPYSQSGSNEEMNLVTACKKCNTVKGDRTPEEAGLTCPPGFGHKRETSSHPVNGVENNPDGGVNPPVNGVGHVGNGKGKGKERRKESEIREKTALGECVEASLVEKRKEKPPHVQFVDRWGLAYQEKVGETFKADAKHFVIAKRLIDKYGLEAVAKKANTLYVLCRAQSAWFTKGGWADFTIEKLSGQWNSIIPAAQEPSKDDEFIAELRKQEEIRARVDQAIHG